MQTLCSDPHYFVLGGLQCAEALFQAISAMGNKVSISCMGLGCSCC